VVGEHSCINKGKCEASVRAKGSTELLVLSRQIILRLLKRNKLVKARLHALMHKRFSENLYLRTGKVTVASAASQMLMLRRMVAQWRDRRRRDKELAQGTGVPERAAPAAAARPPAMAEIAAVTGGQVTPTDPGTPPARVTSKPSQGTPQPNQYDDPMSA